MATPSESITTFSGRRCTRSRARTAATSTLLKTTSFASSESTTSATSTAETQVIETSSALLSDTSPADTSPAVTIPLENTEPSSTLDSVTLIDDGETLTPTTADFIVSTTISEVATTSLSSSIGPAITTAPQDVPDSSQQVNPIESSTETETDPRDGQLAPQPSQSATPTATDSAVGAPAGMIGPEDPGPGLTLSYSNVGPIVGGVVGGFAGIVVISALLFFCLKRRRSREPFAKWQQRLSEKDESAPGFFTRLKTFDVKSISAVFGGFVGKITGKKTGPTRNPYRRHSVRSSASSLYSVQPNRRSHSISEPPSRFRQQLRGLGGRFDRMPSLKKSRTLLQKKQDSLVVGSQSPFVGIVENPVVRLSRGIADPFADPQPPDPPRTLQVLNPDPNSQGSTPKLEQGLSGLQEGPSFPVVPQAVALPDRVSKDPFASILDEIEEQRGSSTPEWLRDAAHKRTHSAATALRSHPPSAHSASIYTTPGTPYFSPSNAPPMPQQSLPPDSPKPAKNIYTSSLPTFNALSSTASRESSASFYFGEPGPSRPATDMFSEISVASAVPRVGRQSDPFDLDRPEVLGFGRVGGRQVRASVTRQNSRTKRMSTVPNWANMDDGPYERASAVPGPLSASTRK